ncbi:P-loop containing nucleoside triphosphate hydrolase protein [Hysterangium stoloniferum]|nr:P-loop containing nucleoside triphosphate hydrolase protein [Hysterangium stoloniferum]
MFRSFLEGRFLRQFWALFRKNWILNIVRCLVLPIAYGVFLAVAQVFLIKPNHLQYGLGTHAPIIPLADVFDPTLPLIWADGTSGSSTTHPSPSDVMNLVIQSLRSEHRFAVRQVESPDDIPAACPQNFNLFSECFAAIAFTTFPPPTNVPQPLPTNVTKSSPFNSTEADPASLNSTIFTAPPNGTDVLPASTLLNYTIRGDAGLGFIDVINRKSDFERRIFPLQWAIDSAIIQLQSGGGVAGLPPIPREWPYSIETDEEQSLMIRLSYIRGLRTLLVLALFINFVGISYQLPGSYATERTAGLTDHLRAMGLRDLPRILSWHISISLAYLPAWILIAILWHFRIFSGTNVGIMIVLHLLTGLSLASYSLFVALPSLPPSLIASISTFLAIILAVLGLIFSKASTGVATVFVLIFPPSFYIFAVRALAGFEVHQIPTSVIKHDPDNGLILLPLIIAALINIFIYPALTVWFERRYYDAQDPKPPNSKRSWFRNRKPATQSHDIVPTTAPTVDSYPTKLSTSSSPLAPAIIVTQLSKRFYTNRVPRFLRLWRYFNNSAETDAVTAISDLSFVVPRGGIFVLLGSNGAGKSTALGVLAGLIGRSGGTVVFPPRGSLSSRAENDRQVQGVWEGPAHPPKGVLGIVPQKNVLFPELTCFQTMQLWSDVKRPSSSHEAREELETLLIDCGLLGKVHANAGSLSGGQKRKLQLAIGLVGGSEIVLVDECTSGVDPLSRRSIWRTLMTVKNERTIVFTTHFLDEADLLADHIAILAAPGKLVAEGSPVALKSQLGRGYTLRVSFDEKAQRGHAQSQTRAARLLPKIQRIVPYASIASISQSNHTAEYALHSKDSRIVKQILETLQAEKTHLGVVGYDIHGTSIEDVFLKLMETEPGVQMQDTAKVEPNGSDTPDAGTDVLDHTPKKLSLTSGRKRSPLSQCLTIAYKRCLILRRSWLSTLLTVLIAVAGSCIPLFFMKGRQETCKTTFAEADRVSLYIGDSPFSSAFNLAVPGGEALVSPPGLTGALGVSAASVPVTDIQDNNTFVNTFKDNFRNISLGGVSINLTTGETLFAWQASPPGLRGPTMLNLASNVLYNRALNASGRAANLPSIIAANYQSFPAANPGTLFALKWVAFFGATMGVYPAFFALYTSMERRTSIQAMQLSNGLTNPAGLWLGHLLFDGFFSTLLTTIIIIVFALASNQFHGLGYLWIVMVLYGFASALFAYCVTLFTASPLAAFAAVAGYQVLMFILYLAGYLLTITYAKNSKAAGIITITHFTVSLASPVASVLRASLVSVNLFSLLCEDGEFSTSSLGSIKKFGGPIAYLIIECLLFFAVLVYVDSGSVLPRRLQLTRPPTRDVRPTSDNAQDKDVSGETGAVETSVTDLLRVLHVSKTFNRSHSKAVDNVSFGVSQDTVFALLGPNGAGKTSIFNIIRGDLYPDSGDVHINGTSIIEHPNTARLSLGVCPQFTAIDPQLTVRQHLVIYGLLKGLERGAELDQNVESLLQATTLSQYADRLAVTLSGGNQRKLSFAIALMGNPTVILIDEYSTGIDAATKRSMWATFRRMAIGKAVVITTHSMEEASALANKVGILAGRMLAIGSPDALAARYALYEVHFPARTREEMVKAQQLISRIPGSRMANDVATRFEVPIRTDSAKEADAPVIMTDTGDTNLSLAELFDILSRQDDFPEYTVERISLESVFIKVIRAQEENTAPQRESKRWGLC